MAFVVLAIADGGGGEGPDGTSDDDLMRRGAVIDESWDFCSESGDADSRSRK